MIRTKIISGLFFISILFTCSCQSKSSEITDIIQPINFTSGVEKEIVISDLFYSENYELQFIKNENFVIFHDIEKGTVKLKPDSLFEGMTTVDFKLDDNVYSIPVKAAGQKFYKFIFKPGKKYNMLTLFGSFNGWNRQDLPMTDLDNDGTFEASAPLEPGVYQYKFFGDGDEIVDPRNPVKVSNGMGDFNSVREITEDNVERLFLHIDKFESINEKISLSFILEYGSRLTVESFEITVLLGNKKVEDDRIEIKQKQIKVNLAKKDLSGIRHFRIAVTKDGRVSNIQTVVLIDGKPIGNTKFTWNDAIIYSIMIDRFSDGDKTLNNPVQHDSLLDKANYMGGDLQGVIDKLNEGYFTKLGINTIWISPVVDNPNNAFREYPAPHRFYSGYHGYWPIHHERVEEKFGTMEKVKELVQLAHDKNIKVLLDFVSNHVHEQHPFFKDHRDWFGKLDLPDGRKNLRMWDEFRLTTWFEPYMPSFDYEDSEEALEVMTDNAVWWLNETGADGFRHDAVKHVPNKFWRELTRKIKTEVASKHSLDVYQIGETFGSYELISSYVNNGQLSSQFNFNVYDVAIGVFTQDDASFDALNKELHKSFNVYGYNNLMGTVMDSHDKNRFMAYADGDLDVTQWSAIEEGWNNPPVVDNLESYKKLILYMAYMNSIPGLPVIYYGSEFGMTGASDPDNRRMMRFGDELTEGEKQTLTEVRKIVNLRKDHTALRYGDFYTLQADKDIYAYARSDLNERILVVLNKNENTKRVNLNLPSPYEVFILEDLVTREKVPAVRDATAIVMDGGSWRMFSLRK